MRLQLNDDPVLELGERGASDFNGVSYPWLLKTPNAERLYNTRRFLDYHISFISDLGVAERVDPEEQFKRYSRSSIFPRTNEKPYGTGSVCVLNNRDQLQMWYTSFVSWQKPQTTTGTFTKFELLHLAMVWHGLDQASLASTLTKGRGDTRSLDRQYSFTKDNI
jgi:hypothetical protein